MTSCKCQGIEVEFDSREAAKKLAEHQKNGPAGSTRLLIVALKEAGVEGHTLLHIDGGIGVIQVELLKAGASSAISVDASTAYIEAAQREARRQGIQERIEFQHGDFVELASGIHPADIVTLDRSLCCYPDMPALVGLSAWRLLGLEKGVRFGAIARSAAPPVRMLGPFNVSAVTAFGVAVFAMREGPPSCLLFQPRHLLSMQLPSG